MSDDESGCSKENLAESLEKQQCGLQTYNNIKSLPELIDRLVTETLNVIETLIDNDSEPPISLFLIRVQTENPSGMLQLIRSLIRIIPLDHPMASNVITLLLDENSFPNIDSFRAFGEMYKTIEKIPQYERNFCLIFGCLIENSDKNSIKNILNDDILLYLIDNLESNKDFNVTLHSLIALEKLAIHEEIKSHIQRKFFEKLTNELSTLENYVENENFLKRQIGHCARWWLDNLVHINGRNPSSKQLNMKIPLNINEAGKNLKISPNYLEIRCDTKTFDSIYSSNQIDEGCWYYEVLIVTSGPMQIGWITKNFNYTKNSEFGIGDDKYSVSIDGCRKLIWYDSKALSNHLPAWNSGTILGCLIDITKEKIIFSLNGINTVPHKDIFQIAKNGFFAGASFMQFQQCKFNFGNEPFKYPPKNKEFNCFYNDYK